MFTNNNNPFIVYDNSAGHKANELAEIVTTDKWYRNNQFLNESKTASKSASKKNLKQLQNKVTVIESKLSASLKKALDDTVIQMLALAIKNAKELTEIGSSLPYKVKGDTIILTTNKKLTIPISVTDKNGEQKQIKVNIDGKLFKETVALYSKLLTKAFRKLAIVGSIRTKLKQLQQTLNESDTNNDSASNTNKVLQLLIAKSPFIAKLYADKDRRIKFIAGLAYTIALESHATLLYGEFLRIAADGKNTISYELAQKKLKQIYSRYVKTAKKYNKLLLETVKRIEKGDNKLRKELAKLKGQLQQVGELYNPSSSTDNKDKSAEANNESLQLIFESLKVYNLQDKKYLQALSESIYLTEGIIDLIKSALLKVGKILFTVGVKIGLIIGWFVDGTLYLIAPFRRVLSPIVKPIERAKSFFEQAITKGIYSAMTSYGIPNGIALQIANISSHYALGMVGALISGIPLPAAAKFVLGSYGAIYGVYQALTEYAQMSLDLKKKADVAATINSLRQTWNELQSLVDSLITPDALDEEIQQTTSA